MSEVASREVRNNTRAVLEKVGAGESVTITSTAERSLSSYPSVDTHAG